MTQRLREIADCLKRGDALSGAAAALDGWEARNIGAARMRLHLAEAHDYLIQLSGELKFALDDLCREHEAMARELERRPVRLSVWARIFGVNHE
jgi:hypothetical protein